MSRPASGTKKARSSLTCPECQAQLASVDYRGIRLDECPKCRGRWFDRDELRKAKDSADADLRWLDFDIFGADANQFAVPGERQRCPICSTVMKGLTYEHSGVIVDKCPRCQGIWLNHGEFERIVTYLEELVLNKPASEYVRDAFKQFVEIATGPENRLSEIRDFLAVLKLLEMRFDVESPALTKAAQAIYQHWPFKA